MNVFSSPSYRHCRLCPHECGVDRTRGELGFCGEGAECRVANILPHCGEEPPISGTQGSGTVFFSGCSCGCFFCQNHQISTGKIGSSYTLEQLWRGVDELARQGVHNINFVTPTHFWLHVREICQLLHREHPGLPAVFNSSGYQRADLVPEYAEHIDIFMPDIKYSTPELAEECMGCRDYPEHALSALHRMVEIKGFLEPFDPAGASPAKTGVLVRHLVLPGHVENSLVLLRTLRHEFGCMLPLSIMSQYHPVPGCSEHGAEFSRRLRADEYSRVQEEVENLGFRQVFVQEHFGDSGYLPDFEEENPFNRAGTEDGK
jgi:putative pyruvate formate lyase activating enzyme